MADQQALLEELRQLRGRLERQLEWADQEHRYIQRAAAIQAAALLAVDGIGQLQERYGEE